MAFWGPFFGNKLSTKGRYRLVLAVGSLIYNCPDALVFFVKRVESESGKCLLLSSLTFA